MKLQEQAVGKGLHLETITGKAVVVSFNSEAPEQLLARQRS
jgi:hypothetical protein